MSQRAEADAVPVHWLSLLLLAVALVTSALRLGYRWTTIEPRDVSSLLAFARASWEVAQVRLGIGSSLLVWVRWFLPAFSAAAFGLVALGAIRRHRPSLAPHVLVAAALFAWLAARSSALLMQVGGDEDLPELVASYRIATSQLILMGAASLVPLLVAVRHRAWIGGALFIWLAVDTTEGLLANLAVAHALRSDATSSLSSLAMISHWVTVAASTALPALALLSFAHARRSEWMNWTRQWLPIVIAAWLGALPVHTNARQRERAAALRCETALQALQVEPLRVAQGRPWRLSAFAVVGSNGEIWLTEGDQLVRVPSAAALPAIQDSELALFVSRDARVGVLDGVLKRVPRETKVSLARLSTASFAPAVKSRLAAAQDLAFAVSTLRIYRAGDYIPEKIMRDDQPEPSTSLGISLDAPDQPLRMLPDHVDYLTTKTPPAAAGTARWRRTPEVSLSPRAVLRADSFPVVIGVTLLTLSTLYALRRRRP